MKKTLTKKHKEKISLALKKSYSKKMHEPEARVKALATFKATLKDPSVREKWSRVGDKNNFWKGGKYKTKNGYMMVYIGKKKYMLEHRIVAEKKIGRQLKKTEVVHHINGIKNDNRPENLIVTSPQKNVKYGSPTLKAAQRRIRQLEKQLGE